MLMKATSWVMKQNSVFIIWMPYGVPTKILAGSGGSNNEKTVHDWPNFSQSDCEKDLQGGDNGTIFTVCDAGGETKGMARIFQVYLQKYNIRHATKANFDQISKEKNNAYTSAIQGWDSALEIPGGWKFDLPTVMVSLHLLEKEWEHVTNTTEIARSSKFVANRWLQLQLR